MLKKSFIIVFIQISGSLLGLITIYFVAGSMEPEVYSLIGVFSVMSNILVTFLDLGIETTMMREALYWIEQGKEENIKEYSTQAILSRLFAFILILPFLLAYILFINYTKYEGVRFLLLCVALLGIMISSLNNAMSLMVRSQGDYVFAQASSTINNYILKFAGLGLYFKFGADTYLYFYALSSIPLFIVYLIKIRKSLDFSFIRIKPMLRKVWVARYLWLKTDLDYVKNNADGLLVSTLFPPSVMGSYTIFKNLEQLSKNIIEGFFDVLSQNTVRYKGNPDELSKQEKKIKIPRNGFIILLGLLLAVFMLNPDFWIRLVHLTKYSAMKEMIVCLGIISIIHLIGKYEINALAFFASSKLNFIMGLVVFAGSVLSFGVLLVLKNITGMLVQRIITYAIYTAIALLFFKKVRNDIYSNIKK